MGGGLRLRVDNFCLSSSEGLISSHFLTFDYYFNVFLISFFFRMSNQYIACSSYIDYSTRRNCPLYNIDNCPTPETPILCPMIENEPRSPCTRFICSTEVEVATFSTSTTSRPTSTTAQAFSAVVNTLIAAGESASEELKDSQVNFFNICAENLVIIRTFMVYLTELKILSSILLRVGGG